MANPTAVLQYIAKIGCSDSSLPQLFIKSG